MNPALSQVSSSLPFVSLSNSPLYLGSGNRYYQHIVSHTETTALSSKLGTLASSLLGLKKKDLSSSTHLRMPSIEYTNRRDCVEIRVSPCEGVFIRTAGMDHPMCYSLGQELDRSWRLGPC